VTIVSINKPLIVKFTFLQKNHFEFFLPNRFPYLINQRFYRPTVTLWCYASGVPRGRAAGAEILATPLCYMYLLIVSI